MKIIISPAKTQSENISLETPFSTPIFSKEKNELLSVIKSMTKQELSQALSVNGKLLDQAYNYYHSEKQNHAITLYTGQVFKGLDIKNYKEKEMKYIDENVVILSALYGILKPFDKVQNYRLDMKSRIGINLYKFWEDKITDTLDNEIIINLASEEFSSLYKGDNIYTITFIEANGKISGTHSKIARGKFLDYMIKRNIKTIDAICSVIIEGYQYDKELSKNECIIYKRK